MIPSPVLRALAGEMAAGDSTPVVAVQVADVRYLARWEGGGRLRWLGRSDRWPTIEELAAEDAVEVRALPADVQELLNHAATVRAWNIARRGMQRIAARSRSNLVICGEA